MMDIVERLEQHAEDIIAYGECSATPSTFYMATGEITRLRAEVERLRGALDGLLKTIDAPGYILREQQAIEGLGADTPLSRARAALHHPRQDADG